MGNVNWRHGGITEFESWWSIGQKFAYLNRVSISDFLFSVQGEETKLKTKGNVRSAYMESIDRHKVAELLNEPAAIFHYSNLDPYIPDCLRALSNVEGSLRYCPICLEYGFHSPVHQLPWLDKCLIHGLTLQLGCPICKRYIGYPYATYPEHRADRYHCKCGEPLWRDLLSTPRPRPIDRKFLRPIRSYLKWVKNFEFPGRDSLPFSLGFHSSGKPFDYQSDAGWVMCCLAAIANVPNDIKAAFREIRVPHHQRLVSTDAKPADIIDAIQIWGYLPLLESFQYWYEQTNLRPLLLAMSKSIYNGLIKGHSSCLKSQYDLIDTCRHHQKSYGFYCSNVQTAVRFSNHWLWLHDRDNEDSHSRRAALELANILSERGIVRLRANAGKIFDPQWSSCGRREFVGDIELDIHVCSALSKLLERLWALEILKSATALMKDSVRSRPAYTTPFHESFNGLGNPLVLLEPGSNDTLDVWIWPKMPSTTSANRLGARSLRAHVAKVKRLCREEVARIEESGYWWERWRTNGNIPPAT